MSSLLFSGWVVVVEDTVTGTGGLLSLHPKTARDNTVIEVSVSVPHVCCPADYDYGLAVLTTGWVGVSVLTVT